jgi:hypothetical protein
MNSPSPLAKRCAYCNEPFRISERRVEAHQAGNQFVCSEFCAQALREESDLLRSAS